MEVFPTRWPDQTSTPILAREHTRDRHVDQFTPSFDHSKVLARNLGKLVLNKKQTIFYELYETILRYSRLLPFGL